MRRIFLGWTRPALESAADLLIAEHQLGRWLDLANVGIVVPGRRASRRLRQRLAERASDAGWHFLPPRLATVGGLPEWCYRSAQPVASHAVQQWSWAQAISRLSAADREQVTGVAPGDSPVATDRNLLRRAAQIQRTYLELAADGWRFGDVASRLDRSTDEPTRQVWNALARTEHEYDRLLRHQGLADLQLSRLQAVAAGNCQVAGALYLLATVELPQLTVQMLQQAHADVTILVFAPPEWEDRFDAFGRLNPDTWGSLPTPLEDDQWTVARGPAEAAERAAQFVAGRSVDDLAVGVADESTIPHLQRALAIAGHSAHWAAGSSLRNSSAWRLLALLRDYLRSPRLLELAQLTRHPEIEAWLVRNGLPPELISSLDHHFASSLPTVRLPDDRVADAAVGGWSRAMSRLCQLLSNQHGSLVEHARSLSELLREILQGQVLDRHDPGARKSLAAYESLASQLTEIANRSPEFAPHWATADTVEWLMDQLARESIPDESPGAAVELLGWLELLLDDAPALVVTGFNEGAIPSRTTASDLLTPSLREQFHLTDERHRYARDTYILSSLITTRQELLMIVQQVGPDDDPVQPSRLLFPSDPEEVARRWRRVLRSGGDEAPREGTAGASHLPPRPAVSRFHIPPVDSYVLPITRLSITQFRAYLACPYRFFLEHVLKLRAVEHHPVEMAAAGFGDFVHEVLARFGRCDRCNSTDEKQVFDALMDYHQALAAQQFGDVDSPIVRMQLARLTLRWRVFARQQAAHAAKGWLIQYVEQPESNIPIPFPVDEMEFSLIGRIDRIDVNSDTGAILILDYKTSENGDSPNSKHRSSDGSWKDLQLPLYRHIATRMGLKEPFQLGYFNLAKSEASSGIRVAEWTDQELGLADATAQAVVRGIRQNRYWPPTDPPPPYSEAWSWICLEGVRECTGRLSTEYCTEYCTQ